MDLIKIIIWNLEDYRIIEDNNFYILPSQFIGNTNFAFLINNILTNNYCALSYLNSILKLQHTIIFNQMYAWKDIGQLRVFTNLLLGEGSFGKVYKGQLLPYSQILAVKAVSKSQIRSTKQKSLFMDEINIISSLKSDNIVKFMGFKESINNYYIVQQLCEGGDLQKLLEKSSISETQSIGFLKQICAGFVTMLQLGIIHRDLKPGNILIHKNTLKICDFGFSKRVQNLNSLNETIVGSPLYMSLQIQCHEKYTSKCDIWALGTIFYQMLHGHTPWNGNDQKDLIYNIKTQPLSINKQLGQNTQFILKSMLTLEQADRIGWDELLRHPIFAGQFDHCVQGNDSFQNKVKTIMNQLRYYVCNSNIQLQELYSRMKLSKDSELNFLDFKTFLEMTGMKIGVEQCRCVFQKIDLNKNNTISFSQLETILKNYNVGSIQAPSKKIVYKAKPSIQSPAFIIPQIQNLYEISKNKLENAFKKLQQRLITNQITLQTVFQTYNLNKNGVLSEYQFCLFLSALDKSFTLEEVNMSLRIIDTSMDGRISYDEFKRYFCECTGRE